MIKKLSQKVAFVLLALVFASSVPFGFGCDTGGKTPGGKDPAATYTITFVTDTEQEIEPMTGKAGSPVSAPTAPVREGFSFGGWLLDGAPYSFTVMPTKNIELSAKWNQIFRITFDTLGGPAVQPIDAAESEQIFAPDDPILLNHKFGGWFEGEERFFFTTMPARDVKLTAKWAEMVTISFDTGVIGLDVNPIREVPGTPVSAPPAPEREGFYFDGWWLAGQKYVFSTMPATGILLSAQWADSVTISFVTGVAGLAVEPIKGIPGTDVKKPKDPVREGYVFDGWLYNNVAYKFSTIPTQSITLTASWAVGTTITFDTGVAGLTMDPLTAAPGKSITAPDAPLRAGFHLDRWETSAGKVYTFNVMPSSNLTLKAKWVASSKLPSVNVTLHGADGSVIALSHGSEQRAGGSIRTGTYSRCTIAVGASENGTAEAQRVEPAPGEIKGRGNGSWLYGPGFENDANVPIKRPYTVKFAKKQKVLGMSNSRHWVLVSSHHNNTDRAMLVAEVAFAASREIFTNIEYTVKTHPVDLFINGEYRGVYILMEKWRAEGDRLAIVSEHNVLDTGYLMKYTSATRVDGSARFNISNLKKSPNGANSKTFSVMSPDADDIHDPAKPEVTQDGFNAQMNFIKGKMQEMADAMVARDFNKFDQVADVPSFVDNIILQELYRNEDHGHGGCYLYKKPGGKIYAGSPWDFDKTCGGQTGFGLINSTADSGATNPFMTYLWAMPEVQALVKARWKQIKPALDTFIPARYNYYINDAGYQSAFAANFDRWPAHNGNARTPSGWKSAAEGNRNWVTGRINWLNGQWG